MLPSTVTMLYQNLYCFRVRARTVALFEATARALRNMHTKEARCSKARHSTRAPIALPSRRHLVDARLNLLLNRREIVRRSRTGKLPRKVAITWYAFDAFERGGPTAACVE